MLQQNVTSGLYYGGISLLLINYIYAKFLASWFETSFEPVKTRRNRWLTLLSLVVSITYVRSPEILQTSPNGG